MSKKTVIVQPSPDRGWDVKEEGSKQAPKHFDLKQDAVLWGRNISRTKEAVLIICKKDGSIQTQDSYK